MSKPRKTAPSTETAPSADATFALALAEALTTPAPSAETAAIAFALSGGNVETETAVRDALSAEVPPFALESVSASGARTTITSNGEVVTILRVSATGAVREEASEILSAEAFRHTRASAAEVAMDNAMSRASALREGRSEGRKAARLLTGGRESVTDLRNALEARAHLRALRRSAV
jgi:PHD/YefM family antitoxin component YafN of YafNO toxin-antitoxin module